MEKNEMENIRDEVQKHLGNDYKVELVEVPKTGGMQTGISCRFKGDDYAAILYPGQYQELMGSKTGTEQIGRYLAEEIEKQRGNLPEIPKTPEEFRSGLYIKLVNADANQELLKNAVYDSLADMAAMVRCQVPSMKEGEKLSFAVTDFNIGAFQMTRGEILEQAYQNTASQEIYLKNMNDVMSEMMNPEMDGHFLEESPLYVLSNKDKLDGANVMACPEILHRVKEQLGEPFYVLPSSTHELLLMPKRYEEKIPVPALEQMVSSVNKSDAVRPEELLSNKVYYYDGKKLTVASEKKKIISDTAEKIIKGKFTR